MTTCSEHLFASSPRGTAHPIARCVKARLAATAMLMAALASLSACGGGSGTADTPLAEQDKPTALSASRPGELTRYVQDRLRERARVAAGGASYGAASTDVALAPGAAGAAPPPAVSAVSAGSARSGSLQAEPGVDEPDLLQTDGLSLYTLDVMTQQPTLNVYRRQTDGSITPLKSLPLTSSPGNEISGTPQGMVLSDDHRSLTVLGQRWLTLPLDPACGPTCTPSVGLPFAPIWLRNSVWVQRVDVSRPEAPGLADAVQIDGRLIDSRRIGDALYVVTAHVPRLPVDALPASASLAEREAAISSTQAIDLLPRVRRSGAAEAPLLADTDCWVQPGNGSLAVEFTTITVFDLRSSRLAPTSRCFVGGTEAVYLTTRNLYLATTRWTVQPAVEGVASIGIVYPSQITTSIHKFALAAGSFNYRGSGEVQGHLGWDNQLKPYRLNESGDVLRVLTYTGAMGWGDQPSIQAASPARLGVLRESGSGGALQEVASLPNDSRPAPLGKPGEQVYGVRFVGDRGYLVTFRRTDPLYVLDLSSTADPRVAGILEVPGFSEQLFPLANGLLLGVGKDADASGRMAGVKVALFDVADAAQPRLAGSVSLGEAGSQSALDYSRLGLNMLDKNGVTRIALPTNLRSGGNTSISWTRGLQRFEVDTATRRLRQLPAVGSAPLTGTDALWQERSVQVGDKVYYLNGTGLQDFAW